METPKTRTNDILTDILSVPLEGAATAKVEINSQTGNLTIDGITSGEPVLASGTLEYGEKTGPPTRHLDTSGGRAHLTLHGKNTVKPWFRFPWAACNGATNWEIHLNPTVSLEIIAFSGGGTLRLDLDGMLVTRVEADSGGGNVEVVLPGHIALLSVDAKTGAGNVDIHVPGGTEARIYATSGLGKVIVDSRFNKIDSNTYQSLGYDDAAYKAQITAKTGAGNVSVKTR